MRSRGNNLHFISFYPVRFTKKPIRFFGPQSAEVGRVPANRGFLWKMCSTADLRNQTGGSGYGTAVAENGHKPLLCGPLKEKCYYCSWRNLGSQLYSVDDILTQTEDSGGLVPVHDGEK